MEENKDEFTVHLRRGTSSGDLEGFIAKTNQDGEIITTPVNFKRQVNDAAIEPATAPAAPPRPSPQQTTEENSKMGDNSDMTTKEAEQYYQKAIDGAFKSLETHLKAMETYVKALESQIGSLRWTVTTGIALVGIVLGVVYFALNSSLNSIRNEIQANSTATQAEVRAINTRLNDMYRYIDKSPPASAPTGGG